ncbi:MULTISPECIES: tRNA (adenosine(37)-N6)-threonylcarbamoyltransferase complex dimerization subunit type 1 TsaB [unclassified Microbacterium]|uniref:tRNA (adenosine(37)-N6)-threonylcarbamoyltransferase complex dimerization subunit type 1 TsaB n=1 Tax=unclassified Microbacterium TaxID=2609290 RepID=UPI000CFE274E|nr:MULTISPECIES: tRNA (adenosine(37)-N6)-threonylcarbamoyltransferase complex dimerization subunit type 1 TsaB [unclassified Microbacterium]PQZ54081.1 tRNA (adenosine(37)-N6)-threonylcarbamoyltransferase complex dimerization subunit type 1 TsaB [Microbacterium sp. MYb43]PQZ81562.1 tRNA (adenosine(37)-N6)-threonylcarbamoyltransferase complex dimerization subunit type 1 TsaB [Microbacterium sp. MYb40]PRB21544.1 tRNA (adenosine(37)-N6)-threonylcarbamoyltransferase complex dimerization subunit type 
MILAVDTSLGTAVALIDADGARRAEVGAADPLGHAEVIGDLLVDALQEAGDGDVTHVVAGMGPGPFTGLRIGIATARAFALGRGLPVIPVPSHFAAALTMLETETTPFAIVTDARRREVAITVFDGVDADGIPVVVAETVLVRAVDADAHLDGIRRIDVTTLSASDLARVGARALAAGRTLTGDEPLYMRHPDVTLPGAPKKVGT